jgi:DNA-binding transcriptional ArsR family regulator
MDSRHEKDALFEAIALMGKAFASPRRLELLDLLAQAPRTVDELARASEQSTANTSQHLQALHAAGMVTRAREGTSVRYSIASDTALALWLALRDASVSQLAARSIPLDELEDRLAELPRGREVVAYCRGPYCAFAHDAVRRLQAAGRTARRLEEGWPEWRLAG